MAKVARLAIARNIEQGDLNPVGMVVASMLTETQFQSLNGTSWVLAAGQSVAGSSYATVTGTSTAPDLRGRVIAGVDNMGGSAANRLTPGGGGIAATILGSTGGAEVHTLTAAQSGTPAHAHGVTDTHEHLTTDQGHGWVTGAAGFNTTNIFLTSPDGTQGAGPNKYTIGKSGSISVNNSSAANASSAHQNTQPTIVMNYFIKIN